MTNESFGAFILTHGRPNNVLTYNTLKRCGYTGKIFIIIDNEDKTAEQYYQNFGRENVIMFDKAAIGETFDLADTQTDRRATVFARNASFDIAKQLGLKYYIQLDDDYTNFYYKSIIHDRFTKSNFHALRGTRIKQMDAVFDEMISLLESTNATSVAMAQGGEFMGGENAGVWKDGLRRKCMNSWLFRTDRRTTFIGRMNDDVSTYVVHGTRGELFFTTARLSLIQLPTQATAGGMTEIYLDAGTYMKTMYTVMMAPSCTKVSKIGHTNPRIHHHIDINAAYPKIISDTYLK